MILVIAYGNSLRRDDGAGLVLARQLVQRWRAAGWPIEYVAMHQLVPESSSEIARRDVTHVLFFDTRVAVQEANPTVEVRPILQADESPSMGHHLGPEVLLLYAEVLFGHRPLAWQVTVPGFVFEHGEGLSERCRQIVDGALSRPMTILPEEAMRWA